MSRWMRRGEAPETAAEARYVAYLDRLEADRVATSETHQRAVWAVIAEGRAASAAAQRGQTAWQQWQEYRGGGPLVPRDVAAVLLDAGVPAGSHSAAWDVEFVALLVWVTDAGAAGGVTLDQIGALLGAAGYEAAAEVTVRRRSVLRVTRGPKLAQRARTAGGLAAPEPPDEPQPAQPAPRSAGKLIRNRSTVSVPDVIARWRRNLLSARASRLGVTQGRGHLR